MTKHKREPNTPVTVGCLFAAIGGFCKAFKQHGAAILWANEKDRFATETFKRIQMEIQKAGYWFTDANARIVNTAEYTDIPQNRERVFMVAMSRHHFPSNSYVFPPPA